MIKIKLIESEIHRNETTFRPLMFIQNELKQVGIELFTDNNVSSYDFALVGQASIANKKRKLDESVDMGLEKLNSITGDYIILDGQDSTSLIGTIDVFRHVYNDKRCKLFLKTSYLKDFDNYKKEWVLGRMYWGYDRPGPDQLNSRYGTNYSVPDIDGMKSKMKLAGFNWLSTIQPNWNHPIPPKSTDVWAFFQYPMNKKVYEHEMLQSVHYDNFRKGLHDKLELLESKYKIIRMKDGIRVSQDDYYQKMFFSKIIIAALGYGEMAPRDIESAMFNSVLFKNDMSHIQTIPNPYIPFETYVPIKWNWEDVEEKIDIVLHSDWKMYPNNLKKTFIDENSSLKRVIHWYDLIKNIDNVNQEEVNNE